MKPIIVIKHEGGNTIEGPVDLVLATHLAPGWQLVEPFPISDDDLVSPADVGRELGLSRSIVNVWERRHDDFPKPAVVGRSVRLWSMKAVKDWHNSPRA